MGRRRLLALTLLLLAACADEEPKGGADLSAWLPEGLSAEARTKATAAFNRGVALMERYEAKQAIPAFQEALRHAPGWAAAEFDLGVAYLNAEMEAYYAKAEESFRRVVERAPDDPRPHFALALLLQHLGKTAEAEQRFRKVLALDPGDPDAAFRLALLLLERDPAEARRLLERTVERVPHHEAATYHLFALVRDAGDDARAEALLARFQALKDAKAGQPSGMKYGEMGRYADIVRAFERAARTDGAEPTFAPLEIDRWSPKWRPIGTPAAADVDGDGRDEVWYFGRGAFGVVVEEKQGRLTLTTEERFDVDAQDVRSAWFGDMDGDGDPDLFLACSGPDRLFRNDGGTFVDATAAAGIAGGAARGNAAAWFDADADGDLDLYVGNDGPNALWRNDGNGRFTDVAAAAGLDGGSARTTAVLPFDLDGDSDLDLLVVDEDRSRVLRNDRVGAWTDVSAEMPAVTSRGGSAASLGDLDGDGVEEVAVWRGASPPTFFRTRERTTLDAPKDAAATGGLLVDLDLDGDLDVLGFPGGGTARDGTRWWCANDGRGALGAPRPVRDPAGTPVHAAVAFDIEGDGTLEVFTGGAPQFWRVVPPKGRRWLTVAPDLRRSKEGGRPVPDVVGLHVEAKFGRRIATGRLLGASGFGGSAPPMVRLGLGEAAKADYVRLVWPDGVLQSEMEVAADQVWRVAKVERKPSSCPVLFAWDGTQFAFVTDFLGVGGVGFFVKRGAEGPEYAPPDPTEDVRIPPDRIAPKDGRYLLRVAEPLEEVTWLDEARLVVHEHPTDVEVFPDERFTGSEPWPTGRPIAVREKVFPVAARDEAGRDVLDRVLAADRRTVDVPVEPRFVGYAKDHWLEMDFGERARALPRDARVVLFLDGWVEYTYSHVNYAAGQAGLELRSPRIEVPDGKGGWRTGMAECGFPAGLPRTMTVDVSALPLREDGRLRIRTNMQVYWDRAFLGADVSEGNVVTRTLEASSAELRPLGYPREYSPDGSDPTLYDYRRVDVGVPFRAMEGDYTRFGDVRELLRSADERSVVMGRGEEIALAFDAADLPPLPEGRARTVCLHADGWCKDMDLYTAFPDTVEPTPWHGMENYPPARPYPDSDALREYRRTWNTRRVAR